MICPQCGSQQPDGVAFCDQCGAALGGLAPGQPAPPPPTAAPPPQVAMGAPATCPQCGTPAIPGEAFCHNCGAPLPAAVPGGAPATPPPAPPWAPAPPPPIPTAGVQTCPHCGAPVEPDSAFCDQCGAPLTAAPVPPPMPTPPPGPIPAPPSPAPEPASPPPYSPFYTPAGVISGRLIVQGTNAVLLIPPGKSEILIGREDPVSNVFPDIDLTPYGGDEGGVSRRHARIFAQGNQIFVEDLNSTNYTYVNQQKLTPGQPHPLKNGDEVRLGKVRLTYMA